MRDVPGLLDTCGCNVEWYGRVAVAISGEISILVAGCGV
uniref:Uncharacterized protein n=1 Tax=Peronospora matthiolae TaxID=2874970 RepID=A0AAV1V743_9STRA